MPEEVCLAFKVRLLAVTSYRLQMLLQSWPPGPFHFCVVRSLKQKKWGRLALWSRRLRLLTWELAILQAVWLPQQDDVLGHVQYLLSSWMDGNLIRVCNWYCCRAFGWTSCFLQHNGGWLRVFGVGGLGWEAIEEIQVGLDFCCLAYATRRSSAKVICFELILSGSHSESAMLDVYFIPVTCVACGTGLPMCPTLLDSILR